MEIYKTENFISYDYSDNTKFVYEISTKDTYIDIDVFDPHDSSTIRDVISVHIEQADIRDEQLLNSLNEFSEAVKEHLNKGGKK